MAVAPPTGEQSRAIMESTYPQRLIFALVFRVRRLPRTMRRSLQFMLYLAAMDQSTHLQEVRQY
jgi:hypothetical protein